MQRGDSSTGTGKMCGTRNFLGELASIFSAGRSVIHRGKRGGAEVKFFLFSCFFFFFTQLSGRPTPLNPESGAHSFQADRTDRTE